MPKRQKLGHPTEFCSSAEESREANNDSDVRLLLCEEDPETGDIEESQLRSKHAIAFQKVLGNSLILSSFDNLHYKLKNLKRKPSSIDKTTYENIFGELQKQVEKKRGEIVEEVKSYEQSLYRKHNTNMPMSKIEVHLEIVAF